jgi:Pyridoxal-phosphate dependent enzyme
MSPMSRTRSAAREAAGAARQPAVDVTGRGGTILDAIGDTPLVMVDGIWVKLEYLNPSGSIKARIARYMIERGSGRGCCGRVTPSWRRAAAIPGTR